MGDVSKAETDELNLVRKFGDRIILASNKPQTFHDLLQRALAPILLKASSEHGSVRTEVFTFVGRLGPHIRQPE